MPRFRFTIRLMMIAIALVAVPLGVLTERRQRFSRIAAHYGGLYSRADWTGFPSIEQDRDQWYAEMYEKYTNAAERPWLPVPPDRPMPR